MKTLRHNYNGKASMGVFFPYVTFMRNNYGNSKIEVKPMKSENPVEPPAMPSEAIFQDFDDTYELNVDTVNEEIVIIPEEEVHKPDTVNIEEQTVPTAVPLPRNKKTGSGSKGTKNNQSKKPGTGGTKKPAVKKKNSRPNGAKSNSKKSIIK